MSSYIKRINSNFDKAPISNTPLYICLFIAEIPDDPNIEIKHRTLKSFISQLTNKNTSVFEIVRHINGDLNRLMQLLCRYDALDNKSSPITEFCIEEFAAAVNIIDKIQIVKPKFFNSTYQSRLGPRKE